ncbi:hypothetical protein SAMD00079811_50430 [Scytonema sp. HK-05]|nr:hypothetical protein SAMD00079811_50430 [Scytonema sp. HK-05]
MNTILDTYVSRMSTKIRRRTFEIRIKKKFMILSYTFTVTYQILIKVFFTLLNTQSTNQLLIRLASRLLSKYEISG